MSISRSKAFQATRKQHLLETAEDYTELVSDMIASRGEARVCQMAEQMGVSHVTVLRTVKRLERDGFLKTAPHQPIILTRKGKSLAIASKKRHKILFDFLIKLGVPKDIAEQDVEGIEHHISPETLRILEKNL